MTQKSVREKRREARKKNKQRKQIRNILIITGVGLLLAALLIYPSLAPVGDIVEITPKEHPVPNDGTTIGFADAPVTIELFEDFQCPACGFFTTDIEPLVLENYVYTGQAKLVFMQYPFLGPESLDAAEASLCARDQGRFWDYHDILFANMTGENIGAYSGPRLEAYAESLGLDTGEFDDCLRQNPNQNEINDSLILGQEYGIPGTPSVVVNGQLLPDFGYPTIGAAIEAALLLSPSE